MMLTRTRPRFAADQASCRLNTRRIRPGLPPHGRPGSVGRPQTTAGSGCHSKTSDLAVFHPPPAAIHCSVLTSVGGLVIGPMFGGGHMRVFAATKVCCDAA